MRFTHSFFCFATLRKSLQPRQRRLTVCMRALSTTSKQCFEQPAGLVSLFAFDFY
ncbi:Uncharacterised protein [Streptococcus pneumoniae]|nr:Uncharacterised protein [Streptococcus pneumoniae]